MGYELARAIVPGRVVPVADVVEGPPLHGGAGELENWSEGPVFYWPEYAQKKGQPPLPCRLIRVPARGQAKHDVWLLTDVLDPARLSAATAAKFYRWRWRNEGVFRIYKRTINKMKLSSRTVRLVHREAEVSLLALQLLLAHADLALRPAKTSGEPVISPRKVLMEIRRELKGARSEEAGVTGGVWRVAGRSAAAEQSEGEPRMAPSHAAQAAGTTGSPHPDRRTESLAT